jgi:hypothetical protein
MVAVIGFLRDFVLPELRLRGFLLREFLLREFLLALHSSRARQASEELLRHRHLIDYARRHPLILDDADAAALAKLRHAGRIPSPHPTTVDVGAERRTVHR